MQRELEARGLTSLPTPKRPSKPIGKSTLQRILTNPYYRGQVRFKGAVYPGAHESLVPKELWYQVQNVLESHVSAADATQLHAHYLKGTIYCGACGSRFIIVNANNGKGRIYPYFVCNGRHSKATSCTRQAILIEDVERLVEKYYESIQISGEMRQSLAGMVHAEFDHLLAEDSGELESLAKERSGLEEERLVVLRVHYSGAISLELLKEEQMRIEARLDDIKGRLSAHHDEYAAARENLDDCLTLLANVSLIYSRCDNQNRRLCNQAFFRKIFIDQDREVRVEYQPSYEALCDIEIQGNALNWAEQAKKKDEVQTFSRVETLVEGLNLAHMGSLRSTFSNLTLLLKTLVTRWKRGVYRVSQRSETAPSEDSRGTVVRRIEHLQTFLTAAEVDRLVDDYLDGTTVNELADSYGVHRATVSAHLTRRRVGRRRPGLGVEEAAVAVRLHLGGVSMRAIAQSMGVDRKAVRRALVEAGAILAS